MNEKFRAKEVLLLLAAASCLRIPIEFLTLNAEKKVVARTPFISFAGQYLSPGQSLELVDENLRVSVNAIWQKLISKVDTLLNPYTPFDAYREAHDGHIGRVERRVMSAIELCRTAALGGHVETCAKDGKGLLASG